MVLHRPVELARIIGHVVLGHFHLSGFRVYQELARLNPEAVQLIASGTSGLGGSKNSAKSCFGTCERTIFELEFVQTTTQAAIRIFSALVWYILRLNRLSRIKRSVDMRVRTQLASVQQAMLTCIHSTCRARDSK